MPLTNLCHLFIVDALGLEKCIPEFEPSISVKNGSFTSSHGTACRTGAHRQHSDRAGAAASIINPSLRLGSTWTRGVHALLVSLVNGALASAPGETRDARRRGSRVEDERSEGRRQCQDWDDDHHGSLGKAPATMRVDSRRHRAIVAYAAGCRLHPRRAFPSCRRKPWVKGQSPQTFFCLVGSVK